MKDKIIEAAGKVWKYLGAKGPVSLSSLPKGVSEETAVVFQALGWLAREDKIEYIENNKKKLVGLVWSELESFKSVYGQVQNGQKKQKKAKGGNNRIKTLNSAGL